MRAARSCTWSRRRAPACWTTRRSPRRIPAASRSTWCRRTNLPRWRWTNWPGTSPRWTAWPAPASCRSWTWAPAPCRRPGVAATGPVKVFGFDADYAAATTRSASSTASSDSAGAVLSAEAADAMGAGIGDPLAVALPDGSTLDLEIAWHRRSERGEIAVRQPARRRSGDLRLHPQLDRGLTQRVRPGRPARVPASRDGARGPVEEPAGARGRRRARSCAPRRRSGQCCGPDPADRGGGVRGRSPPGLPPRQHHQHPRCRSGGCRGRQAPVRLPRRARGHPRSDAGGLRRDRPGRRPAS